MAKSEDGQLIIRWKTVSVVSLIGIIPVVFAVHAAYENHLTRHTITVVEPIIEHHTFEVEGRIDLAQETADEIEKKVVALSHQITSLQVSSAISTVAALQNELDRHERNPENSESWRRERDRLKRQIDDAKEYRQCLIDQNPDINCDLLRGW